MLTLPPIKAYVTIIVAKFSTKKEAPNPTKAVMAAIDKVIRQPNVPINVVVNGPERSK